MREQVNYQSGYSHISIEKFFLLFLLPDTLLIVHPLHSYEYADGKHPLSLRVS